MSHFAVLVVGDDVERQLAPYHEFECTGVNDEYVQDVDITNDVREHMANCDDDPEEPMPDSLGNALEWWGLEDKIVASLEEVDRDGEHKYGYVLVQNNQLVQAVQRTNPNKKWDWWVIGGRWSGFFKVKTNSGGLDSSCEPGVANQIRKGDVDFEGMQAKAEQQARHTWNRVREVSPMLWESWVSIRNRTSDDSVARQAYRSQPGLEALWGSGEELRWIGDEVLVDLDTYVKQARAKSVTLFAIVKDGQWYERGKMGWWGTVGDATDIDTWSEQFAQMIKDLPDDTLLSVVDCHI